MRDRLLYAFALATPVNQCMPIASPRALSKISWSIGTVATASPSALRSTIRLLGELTLGFEHDAHDGLNPAIRLSSASTNFRRSRQHFCACSLMKRTVCCCSKLKAFWAATKALSTLVERHTRYVTLACSSNRTGDRPPNDQAPPDLQPLPAADGSRQDP